MKRMKGRIKLACLAVFAVCASLLLLADDGNIGQRATAFSDGPPPGHTGAPGELTCTNCHFGVDNGGTFTITPPANYTPGQTYQIVVRHVNADNSRQRWGFQTTALTSDTSPAGTFATLNGFTQIIGGAMLRDYVEHTVSGTFAGTTGGAQWTFNWTAPPTNVGPITFYAAGNQANGDGTSGGDRILTATATTQPTVVQPVNSPFDFDGDGKTDIGIFRPGPSEWWINRSGTSQTLALQFGASGDMIAPGDFTGDGKEDIALWRPSDGFWFILRSEDFSFFAFPFGATGDIPVPADFDGDGKADPALFRPSSTLWFIARSNGAGTQIVQFGLPGDKPMPSDYDGDNKADIAVRRPAGGNSEWWVNKSSGGSLALVFGADTDVGVPGDYTGDGKTDIAFWRPSNGFWFVLRSEDLSFYAVPFGTTGDIPTSGDFDGDGKWDVAIFRPADANWFIARTTAGTQIVQFGATGDRPIPNAFVR
jgi:hypothetical protein